MLSQEQEPSTNFSMLQILGEENEIKEEESLACFFSSIGVSKRGLLAKRLMIAMRTEFKMTLRILLHCKKVGLVSFFLKFLGRNQDFSKVLSRGESLFNVAREKVFGGGI